MEHKHHRQKDHFKAAVLLIVFSMAVVSVAFLGENNNTTGYAIDTNYQVMPSGLIDFNSLNDLGTLNKGTYYIDSDGIVYWTDANSMPAIAKIKFVDNIQKNKRIYIDENGNIGYLLK